MRIKAKPHCCEEASPYSPFCYVPCNRPATQIVQFQSGEGPYRMCEMCAYHAIKNRNGIDKGSYIKEPAE